MKFAAIAKGAAAPPARVEMPWPGRDEPVPVLVRIIDTEERADAVAKGRAYAVSKGIDDPKDGDEVFALGVKAATLVTCCLDADAPTEPFFASVDEARKLDPDRIAFLYEHWELHQDSHAPQRGTMSPGEYVAKVLEVADVRDPKALLSMRPALLWSYTLFTADLLASFWSHKSPSSSDSEASSAISKTSDNEPPIGNA